MSSAFFYRERRGMFVVVSLAIWLVLLGMFGRYLPANASVTKKQMLVSIHGHQVTGNWIKEDGRWKFVNISKIVKVNRSPVSKTALAGAKSRVKTAPAIKQNVTGLVPAPAKIVGTASRAPATTASILPIHRKRIDKKALRARLADEIGRWAKIGHRWEWRETRVNARPEALPKINRSQARWVRRGGVWRFEQAQAQDPYIHI